jgi:tetratricopeptide (TPR) repeat protein
MNKEKIFLTCEYDKKTPLFAIAANIKYDQKEFLEAIKLCVSGLKYYPNYPSGYVILGKSLAAIGEISYAEKCFLQSSKILGDYRLVEIYRSTYIPEKKEIELDDFQIEELKNILSEFFGEEENRVIVKESEEFIKGKSNIEDRLEALAEELKKAKIVPISEEEDLETKDQENLKASSLQNSEADEEIEEEDEPEVITETMARIHISQGNFKQALKIYEKLKILDPDREKYFQSKINEIKSQLLDDQWT